MRNLYYDDQNGDLHVFACRAAYERWYGTRFPHRDPLKTHRRKSADARRRLARATGLPASTPIGRLLDAYRTGHPTRVHPVEDDGVRAEPERPWLWFREHNSWERETWSMYVLLDSDTARTLAERLCAAWGDNYGEWALTRFQPHIIQSLCNLPYGNYMPCHQRTVMDDRLRGRIEGLLDMLDHPLPDADGQWRRIQETVYKMNLFR
ncbi:hypothetical protein [Bifidobacterium myosotis]|uniref:Uncharacterized protein n=1 Tax=Bifidobacterium myosotis TaxID=1630166 RepID=A0A5M9ZKN7_9BIFI|nr:hypothetical protein [Bifidobacterium myosotis]KAA8828134.1 hypothetical protein EMO91_06750 [Bifidobacterium myosotis]